MDKNTIRINSILSLPSEYIQAVAYHKNLVFVSEYGDKLVVYAMNTNDETTGVSELRTYSNCFGCKTTATDMIADASHDCLLCLTKKGIYMLALSDLSKKTLIENTENCTCMTLNSTQDQLCVGTKKMTLLYSWLPAFNAFKKTNYIPMKGNGCNKRLSIETPLCLKWLDNALFVGCKIAYYLLDVQACTISRTVLTKAVKSSFSLLGEVVSTTAKLEILVLDANNTVYIMDKNGLHSRENMSLSLLAQPYQLFCLYPYLFVIEPKFLTVLNIASLQRIKRFPLDGVFHITVNTTTKEPALLLFSTKSIYRILLQSPEDQIQWLLSQQPPLFDEALHVASNHDLPQMTQQQLQQQYGYYLFSQGLFDESMLHLQESGCSIQDILVLYPELHLEAIMDMPRDVNSYTLPNFTPGSLKRAYEAVAVVLEVLHQSIGREHSPQSDDKDSTNEPLCHARIVDHALSFVYLELLAFDKLKEVLLAQNACEVTIMEARMISLLKTTVNPSSRLGLCLSLLYLFEGKQQYKKAIEVVLLQLKEYNQASSERTQLLMVLTHILYALDSSDESLVFKCSEFIYKEQPDLVMQCFIDEDSMIGHLNIFHVIKHLQHLAANGDTTYKRNQLVLQYLRIVTPHLPPTPALTTSAVSMPDRELNLANKLALIYLECIQDIQEDTLRQQLLEELRELLRTNKQLSPEVILHALPEEGMNEERCILLGKLGRHEEALRLLRFDLHSIEQCYAYCRNTKSVDENGMNAYTVLLKVLLNPPSTTEQSLRDTYKTESFTLLEHYHDQLKVEDVLQLYPDDTSYQKLFTFSSQAITQLTEAMYTTRMKYNLFMSDYADNQHQVALSRQNGVEITETTMCANCGKPIGASAVIWSSDTELYHYNCCEINGDVLFNEFIV